MGDPLPLRPHTIAYAFQKSEPRDAYPKKKNRAGFCDSKNAGRVLRIADGGRIAAFFNHKEKGGCRGKTP
jgi:hypothetical protein